MLIEAGIRFGMPGAVKQQKEELDEEIIEKPDPTVSFTSAADDETDVDVSADITATFSKEMDAPQRLLTLMHGTTAVSGVVTYADKTATFNPDGNLRYSTLYTASVTSDAKDVRGNALAAAYTWTFTTGSGSPLSPGAGDIGGMTLPAGTYKWGTGVSIPTDVTLEGGSNDVWIFQIGQGITLANDTSVILTGGALVENIFWQAAETVDIGTTALMQGVILAQTDIDVKTGAIINGSLLAQTAVTLDANTVNQP